MTVDRMRLVGLAAVLVVLCCGVLASPVFAAERAWWGATVISRPGALQPGQPGLVTVRVENLGDAAVNSQQSPVKIEDILPAGMVATGYYASAGSNGEGPDGSVNCLLEQIVSCTWSNQRPLEPYESIIIELSVTAPAGAGTVADVVNLSGGESADCVRVGGGGQFSTPRCSTRNGGGSGNSSGLFESESAGAVAAASFSRDLRVRSGETLFGLSEFALALENEDGTPDQQAGSHPFQVTSTIAFNGGTGPNEPPAVARDVHVSVPSGLVGDANSIPKCTMAAFTAIGGEETDYCPEAAAVGVASISYAMKIGLSSTSNVENATVPVFNLETSPGEPARFGFTYEHASVTIDASVRSGRDYGIVESTTNLSSEIVVETTSITLWGVPAAPQHDAARGWGCARDLEAEEFPCQPLNAQSQPALLTAPSSCTGEDLHPSIQADAWPNAIGEEGPQAGPPLNQEPTPGMEGCNRLPFSPSIGVTPDVQEASGASGFTVDVHVPQQVGESAGAIAESDVRDTAVTFPEGVAVNPASAGGLQACSESEIGFEGVEAPSETDLFSSTIGSPFCPKAAKIGEVTIKTPLLSGPLTGSLYLASPAPEGEAGMNPFGSLLAMYIVAEEPESGVLLKLPGVVHLNPQTGQITSTFSNTPQLPYEELQIHLFGGGRGPLSTPSRCGTYTTNAVFTPWSGNAPVESQSSFQITSGPGGSACPGSTLPFSPSLAAGTKSVRAGQFTPLTTTIGREDGQQSIQAVTVHVPPGVSGVIAGVPLCGEAQADAGTCGAGSLIGSTTISAGVGGEPYTVTGGKVYLTGPYQGAPFGLSIVTPAVAGPFNLGTVVVRAKVQVDPSTAAITVTTDPTGPYSIPNMLKGIPLQIKRVNVTVERPGFTFNPTDCDPLSVTATVNGGEGADASLSNPFQVTNCAALAFKPTFSASAIGHTGKQLGTGLTVKMSYPAGSLGAEANITKVKVQLPLQMPSQQKTLNKACLAKTFEENPEACGEHSKVGYAVVHTPVLPVPLEGRAYLVSHGGEAFPSLTLVLKGDNVTIVLVGSTLIKKGITTTTFKTVPDVPFSSFQLTLPQGEYAVLGSYLKGRNTQSFCGRKLTMPTEIIAQDGAQIEQNTPIAVTGCPKPHKAKKGGHGKKASRHGKKTKH